MSVNPGAKSAVFLDRDGTVIDELGYLASPDGLRLLPGAADAIARLNAAGLCVVIITNQSGIARELFDEDTLEAIHAKLQDDLAPSGAHVDAFYHCPHHPEIGAPPWRQDCDCRKPRPGMYLRAAQDLSIDMASSYVVGDTARDLLAAANAGITKRILVRTGKGTKTEESLDDPEAAVVDDLSAAVDSIIRGA